MLKEIKQNYIAEIYKNVLCLHYFVDDHNLKQSLYKSYYTSGKLCCKYSYKNDKMYNVLESFNHDKNNRLLLSTKTFNFNHGVFLKFKY